MYRLQGEDEKKNAGSEAEWAVYDFGEKVNITEINMRFLGNQSNPQSVTVYQAQDTDFVIVKRMHIPQTTKKLHVS